MPVSGSETTKNWLDLAPWSSRTSNVFIYCCLRGWYLPLWICGNVGVSVFHCLLANTHNILRKSFKTWPCDICVLKALSFMSCLVWLKCAVFRGTYMVLVHKFDFFSFFLFPPHTYHAASWYYQIFLFTNWGTSDCLKNNIKIDIKTTPTCFGAVTPSSGSALFLLMHE
jgi:hypothetical protein